MVTPMNRLPKVAGFLLRGLLALYPPRVRRTHREEILAAATGEWRRRGGWRGAGGYVVWLLVDVARSRADERRVQALRSDRRSSSGTATDSANDRRPRSGSSPAGALRNSHRRSFAPPPARGLELMETIIRELRHAGRALLRRPVFTLTAVVTLALGIGATTAVFSVVDAVLLRPLPYPRPDELVVVAHVAPRIASGEWGLSQAGYFYFREHAPSLADIGVYSGGSSVMTGDGPPERLPTTRVTWSVMSTMAVNPELGRPFTLDDDVPGAPPVAIISDGLWRRAFGADPAVLGRTISLDGTPREIVGVMPESFRFPSAHTDAWLPWRLDPAAPPVNSHQFEGIARLREGVDIEDARLELGRLMERFAEDMPTAYGGGFMENSGFQIVVRGLLEDRVGNVRTLLWIVLAAAGIVLIIACANVVNLIMLRSEGRRREVAVRTALGANRAALLRYSLSEAAVLSVAGGLLGVLVAWGGVRALVVAAPAGLPRLDEISLNPAALLVALVTVTGAALVLGSSSTWHGGAGLAANLAHGSRASGDRNRLRLRAGLVVAQVAMALVLMAGAGLLVRSFLNLRSVDPGFSPANVLTLTVSLSPVKYESGEATFRFFDQLTERIRALPGVTAAGAITGLPLVSRPYDNLNGLADLPGGEEQNANMDTLFAGPGLFEALGMRIVEGRTFERRDMEPGTEGAIITRAMAEEYWPGESPLGKRARPLMTDYPWHTIVGVVEDIRTEDLTRAPEPTVYFPYTDLARTRSFSLAIRTEGPPAALLPAVRREVWTLDPDVPLGSAATMQELVADHFSRTTFTLTLVGIAAALALALGAVGIYGVISYAVSQRSFEIGIRMALGARAPQVAGMVVGQTLVLAVIGIGIGLGLALAATRLMSSLLFEVAPGDPLTLAAVAFGLAAVAAAAGALPARRAAQVDAVVALRKE
jgi:predicted permease